MDDPFHIQLNGDGGLTKVIAECEEEDDDVVEVEPLSDSYGETCLSVGVEENCEGGSGKRKELSTESGWVPTVGQVFEKWEAIEEMYRKYGEREGFGIVRAQSSSKGKGEAKRRRCVTWRCDHSGNPDKRSSVKKDVVGLCDDGNGVNESGNWARRLTKRVGCQALVYGSVQNDETWSIKRVQLEHNNHVLTPGMFNTVGQCRSKFFQKLFKRQRFNDTSESLALAQVCASMVEEREGLMAIRDRDLRNTLDEQRRLKLQEGDADAMWKFFLNMYVHNPNFFHCIRLHDSGVLRDVLWIDARSRAAFEEFGDVVYFDTTCVTNGYHLPFANFVGVNHHGQSILLGCVLISHEDVETYEWVFKTWLQAMGGKAPMSILTQQVDAVSKALSIVIPDAGHKWCHWHIIKKFPAKLGLIPRYKEFSPLLKNLIYNSFTGEEFESKWEKFLKEYELEGNGWLQDLYQQRHVWVPAFTSHIFCTGMSSIHKAGGIHSFFDTYFNKHTRLYEFLEKYCSLVEERALMEKEADDICARYVRGLFASLVVEREFQGIYTDSKFREVQLECQRLIYISNRQEKAVSEHEVEHTFIDRVYVHVKGRRDATPTDELRMYIVKFNKLTIEVSCECKMFECNGILCRHCISVLDMYDVSKIPERYILRRWRKDIRRKHVLIKVAYHDETMTEEVRRYNRMHAAFESASAGVMDRDDATELVLTLLSEISEMRIKLAELLGDQRSSEGENTSGRKVANSSSSVGSGILDDYTFGDLLPDQTDM